MSQPHDPESQNPLDIGSLTFQKTMFAIEGNPHTVLVTRSGNQFREEVFWFPHPATAFQWCLKNDAGFVYAKALQNVAGN